MPRYRVGKKVGSTIYRNDEEQPCGWFPGDQATAELVVSLLNRNQETRLATARRERQTKVPGVWVIGDSEPAGEHRPAFTTDMPTFGIDIGEHQMAVEVHTTPEDRDKILRAIALLEKTQS